MYLKKEETSMLGFCESCHDMVEYNIQKKEMTKNIKGIEIDYVGKIAICNECGSEIFVADIRDYNLRILDNTYREKEGLITVLEMEMILEKYNIGKRPLSLLLKWGEGTLTRYLDGDIPNKQYSDVLKKILNQPKYMKELLEKNKENITELAYNNCNNTISEIQKISYINISSEDKIDLVVKYILTNCYETTPLALQKLLYYSQGFYTAFTDQHLFYNNCEAWVRGPVYRMIYHKYKKYGCNPIDEKIHGCTGEGLTELEIEVINSVISNFGCYSGTVLERMTHAEMPWSYTRRDLKDYEYSDRIIEKDLISKYFNDVKQKHNMINVSDIRDYSMDLFSKLFR